MFEDSFTFRGALKTAARTVVASKYNLDDAEFDPDRHSNQQGWWDDIQDRARELIEKCTFLHEGEDENVSDYTELIADAYGHRYRVYRIILITPHWKNCAYPSTTAPPVRSGIYFLRKWERSFRSMLSRWQRRLYVTSTRNGRQLIVDFTASLFACGGSRWY